MQKVKIAMESSKTQPLIGSVHVDEFVIGGKETGKKGRSYDSKKSKVVCAIELTEKGKIKRGYAKVIDDYSANSIEPIFKDHISLDANIKTDKWTAYKKLSKKYSIVQEKSKRNENFKQMHTIIQQIKSGIRKIQTHINRGHLQKYLDEYFFRLNRSIYMEIIFNKLFERMVNHRFVLEKDLVLTKCVTRLNNLDMFRKISLAFFAIPLLIFTSCSSCAKEDIVYKDSVKIQRITENKGISNAFTDLVFFDNQFFLTYRESDLHVTGKDGIIKIYNSIDAVKWNLIKTISVSGVDLRDPKFSVNDDKLMVYIHGSQFKDSNFVGRFDYVLKYFEDSGWSNIEDVFLDNLKTSTYPYKINGNEAWPWRMTWHKNKAYSVGYNGVDIFDLYQSDDGLFFKGLNAFQKRQGIPTEATVRFNTNGEMYIIYRNNKGNSFIGKSATYTSDWDWFQEIPVVNFGGPNFIFIGEDKILITGRESDKVILSSYIITTKEYKKLLTLDSGGDCGYAGMVIKDGILYLSYYSSHATPDGSSVYVARINLNSLK